MTINEYIKELIYQYQSNILMQANTLINGMKNQKLF